MPAWLRRGASAPENDALGSPRADARRNTDMRQKIGRTSLRRSLAPSRKLSWTWTLALCLLAPRLSSASAFKYTSTSDNGKRIAALDIDDPASSTEFELHGYAKVYNVARDHVGGVLYAAGEDASDATKTTLYKVDESDGSLTVVSTIPYGGASAYPIGFDPSGKLWMISSSKLIKLDGVDFAVSSVIDITDAASGATVTRSYMDLSFHPETGELYTTSHSVGGVSPTLSTLDVNTGADTGLGTVAGSNDIMGLAWDATGTHLYATAYTVNASLYEVDLTTAVATALGGTGLSKMHGFTQLTNREQASKRFTAVGASIAAAVVVALGIFHMIRARAGHKVQATVAPSEPARLNTAV